MTTEYEKNADYQDKILLKIINPYYDYFSNVGDLMKNVQTQHEIIHALLSILWNEFHCKITAKVEDKKDSNHPLGSLTLTSLSHFVEQVDRSEVKEYKITDRKELK